MTEDNKTNRNGFGYTNRMVWSVPPKCVLVCKNVINGNIYVKSEGLQVNWPFVRAKLIEVANRTDGMDDSDKVTNRCLDGFEVTVNPAITTSVVDAAKYEFNSKNPETELKVKIQQVLRKLIVGSHYNDLIGLEINLNDSMFQSIKSDFVSFENEYGLKLEKIYLQNVEPSQSMKDDFEKKAIQEKENERRMLQAQNKKAVAEIEAAADKAKLSVFTEVADEFAAKLKRKGINLTRQEIAELLNTYIATRGENDTKIISLGLNDSKASDAATAGVVIQKTKKA